MSDEKNYDSMNDMMEQIDASMKRIEAGDVITGKVISVSDKEVLVNIGFMSDGIVPKEETHCGEDMNLSDVFKEGDDICVYVEEVNDGEGNVRLSELKAENLKAWQQLEDSYKSGMAFDVTVKEAVKGGLVAFIKDIRAFIPASQVSYSYVDDLSKYSGKTLNVKVIEFDRDKERVILSAREVEKEEIAKKREYTLNNIKPGQKVKGTVKRLAKFGAFVDLGGIDGLIHISQMSWKRINDPSEVVSVGDVVEVYVLDVDKEKERISLALKEVNDDPWKNVNEKYKVNDIVSGTIVNLINSGAFVEIEDGIEGFLHISEICDKKIAKPSDELSIGDKVNVKILEINAKDKRMSLSIKEAADKKDENYENYSMKNTNSGVTIGDLLKDKLKDFKLQ